VELIVLLVLVIGLIVIINLVTVIDPIVMIGFTLVELVELWLMRNLHLQLVDNQSPLL